MTKNRPPRLHGRLIDKVGKDAAEAFFPRRGSKSSVVEVEASEADQ
ncbi:MAG: hypothetical protein HYV07_01975 [Deltaproteobacteria bacterium]|nr:hypothetical protein [Deltaproteobacteria bacterium]